MLKNAYFLKKKTKNRRSVGLRPRTPACLWRLGALPQTPRCCSRL